MSRSPVRVPECLAYDLCRYKGHKCSACLKMSIPDWKAFAHAVIQVIRI